MRTCLKRVYASDHLDCYLNSGTPHQHLIAIELRKLYLLLEAGCEMAKYYSQFCAHNLSKISSLNADLGQKARYFLGMSIMHEREIKNYKLNFF